jgi:hypothetical protein
MIFSITAQEHSTYLRATIFIAITLTIIYGSIRHQEKWGICAFRSV